ncbi:hypothetical protein [Corynebacterium phocae]|uniref:hypothetical protein n=1 Tax=Corynebacterium phocae TaxID=161895 RepID=UPI001238C3C2|nr:hypothetical protein [Corynebacterium phocae]KAA8724917.1 hypothetical protein F4V58_04375 [Corynebacterium phocae]
MRNFRTAAIAAATAVTVAFGGVSIASAQDNNVSQGSDTSKTSSSTTKPGETMPKGETKPDETMPKGETKPDETMPKGETKPDEKMDGDSKAAVDTGKDFKKAADAASSKGEGSLSSKVAGVTEADKHAIGANLLGKYIDDTQNPAWARIWREGTYVGLIAAGISTVIAMYNFAVFNGLIPDLLAGLFAHK